ncbi:hypothetical protein ACLMJK_004805 [Lecanora helva]
MDIVDTYSYSTTFPIDPDSRSRRKSSVVPGATVHSAIYTTSSLRLHDSFISFLSYIKTHDIPILPVTKPDIRSVLGQGASFLVNGAEIPRKYIDPISGHIFQQGMMVAFKRAVLSKEMHDPVGNRIAAIFNELITMHHPPLLAHPNIVNLHGIGFETEGPSDSQNAMPVLIPECAELGNLAEVLETARKEDRPLAFEEKLSMCLDIAHGLEILHACDIVHGDVKCENVLVFEAESSDNQEDNSKLYCKLTDFGVSRHPSGKIALGGSRPWQAPECLRGEFFKLEDAKRTDVYSYGMLVWRVFLDGDPFKSLEESLGDLTDTSLYEKRQRRNDAVAKKKDNDDLVQHVCTSLALSANFSRAQLEMLCEVVNVTLLKDSSRRELDMKRIIRLLTPDNWYEARHPVSPTRLPMDFDANLLDLEKWYSEFESASPVVQSHIASGYRDYAQGLSDENEVNHEEKRTAAAYQLAICYANAFGIPFEPDTCLTWLSFAADRGSQRAQEALPNVSRALSRKTKSSSSKLELPIRGAQPSAEVYESAKETALIHVAGKHNQALGTSLTNGNYNGNPANSTWSLLKASEACRYDIMHSLLSSSVRPGSSEDGVSPLHFLSVWNATEADDLGRKLVSAGADVNALAERGITVGGTPLMWSVYGDHLLHSSVLLNLGADPLASTHDGEDALSFAARLHLVPQLRLLIENVRPAQMRGNVGRLLAAATGGESRFTRMRRHAERWKMAAGETFQLLQSWNSLFPDDRDFKTLVLDALHTGLRSACGRMNTDVQLDYIERAEIGQSELKDLLYESVLTYNADLFDGLLDYGVRATHLYDKKKSLLHLCARIPDHSVAASAFAPRLLDLGASLDAQDEDGITPWMEAVLERKWDLADLLMRKGARTSISNNEGFNILGLCIKAVNLGSVKYLLKYIAQEDSFRQGSFLVNERKQISAIQLAATILLPRAHGMKIEVLGMFLIILKNFALEPWQLTFRSNGVLRNATALDIAASLGSTHAVKNLVIRGAHRAPHDRISALAWANSKLSTTTDFLQRKNLERCAFIIEHWDDEAKHVRKLADDWTNMRTIDEEHVNSSWEIVVFDYKTRKGIEKGRTK